MQFRRYNFVPQWSLHLANLNYYNFAFQDGRHLLLLKLENKHEIKNISITAEWISIKFVQKNSTLICFKLQ